MIGFFRDVFRLTGLCIPVFVLIVLCAPVFGLDDLDKQMNCRGPSSGSGASSSSALPPNREVDIRNRNWQNQQLLEQREQSLNGLPSLNGKNLECVVQAFHQTLVPARSPPDEDEDWSGYVRRPETEGLLNDSEFIEQHNRLHGQLAELERRQKPPPLEGGYFEPERESQLSQANYCTVPPEGYVRQVIEFCHKYRVIIDGVECKFSIFQEFALAGDVPFGVDVFNTIVVLLPITDGVLRARSMDGHDWFFRKSAVSNCFSLSMDPPEPDEANRDNEEQIYPSLIGQSITIPRSSFEVFFVDEDNQGMVVFIPVREQKIIPSLVFDNLVREADSGGYFVGNFKISEKDMLELGEDIITKQSFEGSIQGREGSFEITLSYKCTDVIDVGEQRLYTVALEKVVSAGAACSSSGG